MEQTVQQSSQLEQELRTTLQNQQTQVEIQKLQKEKEIIEDGLRKKHDEEKVQQEKKQHEMERIHEVSRERAEEEVRQNQ